MRKSLFRSLKKIENNNSDYLRLKLGECFLEGEETIKQLITKDVGETITYFKVTGNRDGVISYTPIYDKLEDN